MKNLTKEEALKQIEEAQKQIEELKKYIKEQEEKDDFPSIGDMFYALYSSGEILPYKYKGSQFGKARLTRGLIFQTKGVFYILIV